MHPPQALHPVDLATARVLLGPGGAACVRPALHIDLLADGGAGDAPEHRTVAAYFVNHEHELHPMVWEMHPHGDELLLVASGVIEVVARDAGGTEATALLRAGQALRVPRGTWHRLALHEPGLLLVIGPRAGTRHDTQPG